MTTLYLYNELMHLDYYKGIINAFFSSVICVLDLTEMQIKTKKYDLNNYITFIYFII
jgi:hypothetical protein